MKCRWIEISIWIWPWSMGTRHTMWILYTFKWTEVKNVGKVNAIICLLASVGFHLAVATESICYVPCVRCQAINEVSALARAHTNTHDNQIAQSIWWKTNYISFPVGIARCVVSGMWNVRGSVWRFASNFGWMRIQKHGLMNRSSSLHFRFFDVEFVVRFMCIVQANVCILWMPRNFGVSRVRRFSPFSLLFCHPTTTH